MSGLDDIANLENLERAWRQLVRWECNCNPFFNAYEVAEFENRLSQELLVIQEELLRNTYTFSSYYCFHFTKPSGGRREIAGIRLRDGIVSQAIINVIAGTVQTNILDCSYAYRMLPNNEKSDGIYEHWGNCYSAYSSMVDSFLNYPAQTKLLKIDIADYYNSIDQDRLLAKLVAIISPNTEQLKLLNNLIRYNVVLPDASICAGRGLPVGPAYAHVLANLYLTELDSIWSNKATGYARYVDDIVMVFPDSANIDNIICEIDEDLEKLGIPPRSKDKTKRGTVDHPEEVIDEIRKKKYRIGLLTQQDDEEEEFTQNLNEFFQKTFWEFEDIEEISKVAQHLKVVIRRSEIFKNQDRLVDLAYEVISTGVADPLVCRMAMLLIINQSGYAIDQRFRQIVERGDPLIQVLFLRMVIEHLEVAEPHDLLIDLTRNGNLQVRILAFAALRSRDVEIIPDRIYDIVSYQTETYGNTDSIKEVYAFAATALPASTELGKGVFPLLTKLASINTPQSYTALIKFVSAEPSRELMSLFWENALISTETIGLVDILNSGILSGDLSIVKQIVMKVEQWLGSDTTGELLQIGLRKAHQKIVSEGNLSLLIDLVDPDHWNLGLNYDRILQVESVQGLIEAVQNSSHPDLTSSASPLFEKLLRQDTGNPLSLDGTSVNITLDGVKYGLGSTLVSAAESQVKLVELETPEGQKVLLEMVAARILKRMGFETAESWRGYLRTQRNNGITFGTSTYEYRDIVYTIYHVPEGFHSISSVQVILGDKVESNMLGLIASIGTCVEKSKWVQGKFQSIGAYTVFVDLSKSVRFVGFALAGASPMYLSLDGQYRTESSTTAYQLFLVLLTSELLFGESLTIGEIQDYLEQHASRIALPFKYILSRLSKLNPDHRYDDWETALQDIAQAMAIQQYQDRNYEADDQDRLPLFQLAAYIDFRLSITRRSPRASHGSLREYIYTIIEQYFEVIDKEGKQLSCKELTDPYYRQAAIWIPLKEKKGLLYICKLLSNLADAYEHVFEREIELSNVIKRNVALDLLLSIIWLEAESLINSLAIETAMKSANSLRTMVEGLKNKIVDIKANAYRIIEIAPSFGDISRRPLNILISQQQLGEMVENISRICNHPRHDLNQLNFNTDSQLRFLAWLLMGSVRFYSSNEEFLLGMGVEGSSDGYEWAQSLITIIDLLRAEGQKSINKETINALNHEISGFLGNSRKLHPFQRKQAIILRYAFVGREGKVRYRDRLSLKDRYFDHTSIETLPWVRSSDVLIPCTVDTWSRSKGTDYPMRISMGPSNVVRHHRSGWRAAIHSRIPRALLRLGDKRLTLIRIIMALVALAFFTAELRYDFWGNIPSSVFFLLALFLKWPFYLLYRER